MAKKVLLNIFYNIALFTLFLCIIWAFNHKQYLLLIPASLAIVIFVYFKMRLIKQVKELTRKP